jgi:hypothetical protein
MEHIKKYGIIIVIAVLFALLSFSIVDVILENPKYEDFCEIEIAKPFEERTALEINKDQECRTKFEVANRQHRLVGFIVTSILGVLAIVAGLYGKSKEKVVEWIFSGILIGGILSIIFGTMSYFGDMGRFVKPIVLILEIALIILIALKAGKKK